MTIEDIIDMIHSSNDKQNNLIRIYPLQHQDIGGGELLKEEIDVLKESINIDYCFIMGLKQDTFEYFIKTYGNNFKGIFFFKNKLVKDWSLLGQLKNIEYIYYFHNQRITKLWDMTNNINLRGLFINDFTRLTSIEGIKKAKSLQHFEFGNEIWPTSKLESLKPLENMNITHLNLSCGKLIDEDFSFIEKLPKLIEFNCPLKFLPLNVTCWIIANYPQIKGYALKIYEEWDDTICFCGKKSPTIKKGNPKVVTYIEKFNNLKSKLQGKSYDEIKDII